MRFCGLRIVVFPVSPRTWVARALEHDLAAEGRSIESAIDTVLKIALAHIAYDRRHGREPLSAFAAAPALYWTAFKAGTPLPIPAEAFWSDEGRLAEGSVSVMSKHPAVPEFILASRSA